MIATAPLSAPVPKTHHVIPRSPKLADNLITMLPNLLAHRLTPALSAARFILAA